MKLPFIVQSRPFIGILFLIKRKVYSITIKRHKEKAAYSFSVYTSLQLHRSYGYIL